MTRSDLDAATPPDEVVARLGPIAPMIGATLRHSAAPTMLEAGYKANVIPGSAEAVVDGRFLPGRRDEFLATIDELLGPARDAVARCVDDIALEIAFEGPVVDAIVKSLLEHDPVARAVPYTLSGGTDAKAFAQLGIPGYGFAPLRLPPDPWRSPTCSTASTSGYPSTRSSSAHVCSTASSTWREQRRQGLLVER